MSAWGKAWGFAWGNAWGLLQAPYVDLSGAEKVFVRSVLDAVWSQQTVEQIVSVATLNRISVLDAATVLRVVDVSATEQLTRAARDVVDVQKTTDALLRHDAKDSSISTKRCADRVYVQRSDSVPTVVVARRTEQAVAVTRSQVLRVTA